MAFRNERYCSEVIPVSRAQRTKSKNNLSKNSTLADPQKHTHLGNHETLRWINYAIIKILNRIKLPASIGTDCQAFVLQQHSDPRTPSHVNQQYYNLKDNIINKPAHLISQQTHNKEHIHTHLFDTSQSNWFVRPPGGLHTRRKFQIG
jgi:hypothetical protein